MILGCFKSASRRKNVRAEGVEGRINWDIKLNEEKLLNGGIQFMLLCAGKSAWRDKSPLESSWKATKCIKKTFERRRIGMKLLYGAQSSIFQVIWIIILKKLFKLEPKLIRNPIIMKTPIKVYCTVASTSHQFAIDWKFITKIFKRTSFHVPITGICWWMVQHVVSDPKALSPLYPLWH